MQEHKDKNKEKSNRFLGDFEGEMFQCESMPPPPFQLIATQQDEEEPQKDGRKSSFSLKGLFKNRKNDIMGRNRDKNILNKGRAEQKGKHEEKSGLNYAREYETALDEPIYTNINIDKRGLDFQAATEAEFNIVDYNKEIPIPEIPITIMGEQTILDFSLKVTGKIGAGVQGELDIALKKFQKTKNPLNITKKNLKAGAEFNIEGFAGLKGELFASAKYDWVKKEPSVYQGKIAKNVDRIISEIEDINPFLGNKLRQMSIVNASKKLAKLLFSIGDTGQVSLAEVSLQLDAALGIMGSANGSARFLKGKFYFHAKAGFATGWGFGGETEIALDLVEGFLFGMVVGGELLDAAIPYLKKMFSFERLADIADDAKEFIYDLIAPKLGPKEAEDK